LLHASQFVLRGRHSKTFQCTRLTGHVILISVTVCLRLLLFLDIEKPFETTWHPGLLYKLSQYSINIILPAEGTLSDFLALDDDAYFHSMLRRLLAVVHPCFIACDNHLYKSLSCFMISLQKLHACFHACPFVLICNWL